MYAPDNSTSAQLALRVSSLCKTYAQVVAVEQVSFEVHRREVVGLLGPNGAGKTTTINMILGVLSPTAGSVRIGGIDLARQRGSPVRSLPMFAWVGIDIVVWGFITRYLNSMAAGRFNYVPSLLGAVLMWDFLLPPSYVFEGMRALLAGRPFSGDNLSAESAA